MGRVRGGIQSPVLPSTMSRLEKAGRRVESRHGIWWARGAKKHVLALTKTNMSRSCINFYKITSSIPLVNFNFVGLLFGFYLFVSPPLVL